MRLTANKHDGLEILLNFRPDDNLKPRTAYIWRSINIDVLYNAQIIPYIFRFIQIHDFT